MVERPGPLGADFASLLAATFVTNLGDGIRLAALPLLAATLTSSPLLIGGLTAAQFLPWMTFAPFGGVFVDRSDRRRLIMITQAWRALVMAALGVAVLTDVVQIWQLFVVAFMITVGEILVDPSVVATVPTLVTRNDLDRANGRITTVETVTNDFAGGPIGAVSFAFAPWLPFLSTRSATSDRSHRSAASRRIDQDQSTASLDHQSGLPLVTDSDGSASIRSFGP